MASKGWFGGWKMFGKILDKFNISVKIGVNKVILKTKKERAQLHGKPK